MKVLSSHRLDSYLSLRVWVSRASTRKYMSKSSIVGILISSVWMSKSCVSMFWVSLSLDFCLHQMKKAILCYHYKICDQQKNRIIIWVSGLALHSKLSYRVSQPHYRKILSLSSAAISFALLYIPTAMHTFSMSIVFTSQFHRCFVTSTRSRRSFFVFSDL